MNRPQSDQPTGFLRVSLPALTGTAHRVAIKLPFASVAAFRERTATMDDLACWISECLPANLRDRYPMSYPLALPHKWRMHILWLDAADGVEATRRVDRYSAVEFRSDMSAVEFPEWGDAVWVGGNWKDTPERGHAVRFRYWDPEGREERGWF
ncbi:hypothetical protein ACHAQA_009080 [Verticillium albo-atrum]